MELIRKIMQALILYISSILLGTLFFGYASISYTLYFVLRSVLLIHEDISNAMGFNACISMVKDTIAPQNFSIHSKSEL